MSIEIKHYDPRNGRLTLEVLHRTFGPKGTRLTSDLEVHLSPNATEATDRVSVLSLDLRWVRAATLPQLGAELGRVLERIVAGLREGPGPLLALLEVPPPPASPAPLVQDNPGVTTQPLERVDLKTLVNHLEARLAELDALRRDELVGALRLAPGTSWDDALEEARTLVASGAEDNGFFERWRKKQEERDAAREKMVDAMGLAPGSSWEDVLEKVRVLQEEKSDFEKTMEQARLGLAKTSEDCPCGSHERSRACCGRPCSGLTTPDERKAAYLWDLEKGDDHDDP